MGLFNFFRKKNKITVEVVSEDSDNARFEEEYKQFWEEYHKAAAKLDAENKRKIDAIDFSKAVSGNDDENLSDVEINFLEYFNQKKINDLKIVRRWVETGIDYQTEIEKFFRCGLLTFEAVETVLSTQKVVDLKSFLQEQGVTISGNKDSLVKGIIASVPEDIISAHFPPNRVCLTEKGFAVIEAKRKWELNEKFRTASISSHEHLQSGQLSEYRDDLVGIAEVYIAEEKFQSALQTLMMVFVLDASGAPTPEEIRYNQELIKEGWVKKGEFRFYRPSIVPYHMSMIDTAISRLCLSMQEVEKAFRDEISAEQIPCKFCSVDEMTDLFLSAVSGDGRADELVRTYKERFVKRYAR